MDTSKLTKTSVKKNESKIEIETPHSEEYYLLTDKKSINLELLGKELERKHREEQEKLLKEACIRNTTLTLEEQREWICEKYGYTKEEYWQHVKEAEFANPNNRPNERKERLAKKQHLLSFENINIEKLK